MHDLWWVILGVLVGLMAMLPVMRILLRRAERRARDAERRARDSERLAELGSMTGGLAHEIKNPLSTISLNAGLLAEGITGADLPLDQRDRLLRRLDALGREVERLGSILTDFLQFAGRVKLDKQPGDMVRIVSELSDFFDPQCDQNQIVLRTKLPDSPVPVHVDESLLKQALLNLMINATQAISNGTFNPPGGEGAEGVRGELILRVEADKDEARVHVIDTGPGIEAQQLEAIFHPYVSHHAGGTGLGLSTARRIIEEHGGSLVAHSEVGRGSDFVVHLPLEKRS